MPLVHHYSMLYPSIWQHLVDWQSLPNRSSFWQCFYNFSRWIYQIGWTMKSFEGSRKEDVNTPVYIVFFFFRMIQVIQPYFSLFFVKLVLRLANCFSGETLSLKSFDLTRDQYSSNLFVSFRAICHAYFWACQRVMIIENVDELMELSMLWFCLYFCY